MKTTPTLTLLRDVEVRLVQIASGDYKTCGVFAEDVARDAIPAIQELVRRAGELAPVASGVICEMESLDFENGTKITLLAPDGSEWTAGSYIVTAQPPNKD